MKKLLLLLFALTTAAYAQQATPPKDAPCDTCKQIKSADEKEELSQLMLEVQKTAQELRDANLQADAQVKQYLAPYVQRQTDAYNAYFKQLEALQEKYHAKGCQLNFKKQWVNCPKPEVKPDAKPEVKSEEKKP